MFINFLYNKLLPTISRSDSASKKIYSVPADHPVVRHESNDGYDTNVRRKRMVLGDLGQNSNSDILMLYAYL